MFRHENQAVHIRNVLGSCWHEIAASSSRASVKDASVNETARNLVYSII